MPKGSSAPHRSSRLRADHSIGARRAAASSGSPVSNRAVSPKIKLPRAFAWGSSLGATRVQSNDPLPSIRRSLPITAECQQDNSIPPIEDVRGFNLDGLVDRLDGMAQVLNGELPSMCAVAARTSEVVERFSKAGVDSQGLLEVENRVAGPPHEPESQSVVMKYFLL